MFSTTGGLYNSNDIDEFHLKPLPAKVRTRAPPPAPSSVERIKPPHPSIRSAVIVARQARQFRLKTSSRAEMRSPSPTRGGGVHLRDKKNIHLRLNMVDEVTPQLLTMEPEPIVWSSMNDEEPAEEKSSRAHRRRQSSITMSIDSPSGVEFSEVAHDGPAEIGKHTKRIKRLGKGAGGVVYLSLYIPTLKLVAVKEVVVYKEEERKMVKHELHALHENLVPINKLSMESHGLWHEIRHHISSIGSSSSQTCPYLVAFYGAYLLPAKCAISIVMEFMDMGSLQDLLDAKVSISEPIVRHVAFCCMTALAHMHRHCMIHRDIKPANVLMNHKGEFKIADFGLAGTLSKSQSFFSEFEGTMMYMAPERIQGQPYSYVSDVWSMGVSLFYLATGSYPFVVEDGFFGLEEAIVHDPMPPITNRFSSACRDFIKSLLRRDPNERSTASNALNHPFLRGYSDSKDYKAFSTIWEKMPLHSAIKTPDDACQVADILVQQAEKYPELLAAPIERLIQSTQQAPISTATASTRSAMHRHSRNEQAPSLVTHQNDERINSLCRLGEDCGITSTAFKTILVEATNKLNTS